MNRPSCYNCDTRPARAGSVFCETCAPALANALLTNTAPMPEVIHEDSEAPDAPAPARPWKNLLLRLFAPYRHARNIADRLEVIYRELQDTAKSNLALKRKCADLRKQKESWQQVSGEWEKECKELRAELKTLNERASAWSADRAVERLDLRQKNADLRRENESLAARKDELKSFVRTVRDDYDCDTGAGGMHSPHCRCCTAKKLVP